MEDIEFRGQAIYDFAKKIFPFCRSITGQGIEDTLMMASEYIEKEVGKGFTLYKVPTGTKAFDWIVPKEWVIREAYIEDGTGRHIIDMKDNNLHVVGYSAPIDRWVDLKQLKEYVFVQEDQPEVIPYITSYYKESSGFCMTKQMLDDLPEGQYHMYIDSSLIDGYLTYAEIVIRGESEKEVLFSTYACHPSMANNECSGPALMVEIIRYVKKMKKRRYTYRFVIVPETIGTITYLSRDDNLYLFKKNMIAGFILSCVGDDRDFSIIHSKYGNTLADKLLNTVLKDYTNNHYSTYSFLDRGSDERQYNAPGIDLPVVGFCRTKYAQYPEYHTSADNMELISPKGFQGSYDVMIKVISLIEKNKYYKIKVLCEPQLGKRGLYSTVSRKTSKKEHYNLMNFIAYADGKNDLIDIAERIDISYGEAIEIADKLEKEGLLC